MKTINDDPQGFFDSGGWSFLDPESDVSLLLCIGLHECTLRYPSLAGILFFQCKTIAEYNFNEE